jgi:hypothetical protein
LERLIMLTLLLLFALAGPSLAVDGVLEINQTCAVQTGCFAGDTAGFPVTISTAGSYRLTGNLETTLVMVSVQADNVTVDLNGFDMSCEPPGFNFLAIGGSAAFKTIRNGSISCDAPSGSGGSAIELTGSGTTLESLRIGVFNGTPTVTLGWGCVIKNADWRFELTDPGVVIGDGCLISESRISGSGLGTGIIAGVRTRVENSDIYGFNGAISVGRGSVLAGNTFRSAEGALFASDSVIKDNTFPYWSYRAISGSHNVVEGNLVSASGNVAIECANCTVINNVVRDSRSFALLDSSGATGYSGNQFENNNGGNANPQVSGGIEIGTNVCGGDTICP